MNTQPDPRPDATRLPYAFVFWQDTVGHPAYIDLCRETMVRNLAGHFELIELDFESCQQWWPEAKEYYDRCVPRQKGQSPSIPARQMALFTDLLRVHLLAHYGGLWVDADTIVLPRGAALAALAQRDFFCSEAELGTLGNGTIGGRPGSPFLAEMARQMRDGMAERTEPVGWGEFGFRLIRRTVAERPEDDLFVVPFGAIVQFFSPTAHRRGRAATPGGSFSPGDDYDALVPADALVLTMFNNSTTTEQRDRSREDLVAERTVLSEAYRRAMNDAPSDALLLETHNRAVAAVHAVEQERRMDAYLSEAKTKLRARNETVKELREQIVRLRERITANRSDTPNAVGRDAAAQRREVFQDIFAGDVWTHGGSKSGCGSSLRQTEALRAALPGFLHKHGVRSLLDIPCGDFNWMQHVDLGGIGYVGGDIVPDLIDENRRRFPDVDFRVLDLVSDELPRADCVMVRDCFSHLSFVDIGEALENVRRSGITYLLVTHYTEEKDNADIHRGQFHRLNYCRPPFEFPEPIDLIVEQHPNPKHADKTLALWRVADLPRLG